MRYLVLMLALLVLGCDCTGGPKRTKIEVYRVFMEGNNSFQFLVEKNDGKDVAYVGASYQGHQNQVIIYTDVKENETCYIIVDESINFTPLLEVHVHAIKEIEGGTRSMGKFGTVRLQEIE